MLIKMPTINEQVRKAEPQEVIVRKTKCMLSSHVLLLEISCQVNSDLPSS